jgi:hypothetical protein
VGILHNSLHTGGNMSKTPFEIRLEILDMAKGIVMEDYYAKQNWLREKWESESSAARDTGGTVPNRPENPEFPTSDIILKKAKELKAFIDNA